MISQEIILWIKDGLFVVLLIGFCSALLTIRRLRKDLEQEVLKRKLPVLNLEMEPNGRGLVISNESACFAKYIRIEDAEMELDYDFKRTVHLKFDTVNFLNPRQKAALKFHGSTNDQRLTDDESQGLIAHIPHASFELVLQYANLDNQPFISRIRKDGEIFTLLENHALEASQGK